MYGLVENVLVRNLMCCMQRRWKLRCFLGDVPGTIGELVSSWFDLYFRFPSGPHLHVAHSQAEKKDSCIETGCLSKLLFALEDIIEASACKQTVFFTCVVVTYRSVLDCLAGHQNSSIKQQKY